MYVPVAFRMGDITLYDRILTGIATRAKDLSVPFREIGALLIRDIGAQFASDGAWAGTGWQPLSDQYAQWKEQHYPGRPLLVASGAMRAAMLAPQTVKVTPRRLIYTPVERAIGYFTQRKHLQREYNPAEVAFYHQTGAGHLPARPMVALPLTELREIDRIFLAWLNGREPLSTHL